MALMDMDFLQDNEEAGTGTPAKKLWPSVIGE
jgi:hypothetical protein